MARISNLILTILERPLLLAASILVTVLLSGGTGYWILLHPDSVFMRWAKGAPPAQISMITFGPYPEEDDFRRLKASGVKYIVSLLDPRFPFEDTLFEREKARALQFGMTLKDFPMASLFDRRVFPDYEEEQRKAVDFLSHLDGPAYLHCYLGRNRTVQIRNALLKAHVPKRYWTPVASSAEYWDLTTRIIDAQAELQKRDYAKVIETLEPVSIKDCDVALLRGWSYFRLGLVGKATESFQEGLQVDGTDTRNLVGLGYCYLRSGQPVLAQQQFNAVLQQVPGEPDALTGLGLSFMQLGSKAAAAQAFYKVLELNPANAEVRGYLQQAAKP